MRGKDKNLFDLVPIINEHISTKSEGELSVIAFPRFKSKFMQKYFVPKNKSSFIHIRLDANGTSVWNLIDGKRTVGEIATSLSSHFDESGYEYRIAAFVSQLHRQGYIRLEDV